MFKKKSYVTVVFSSNTVEVTRAGTILMVITGDKNTKYRSSRRYFNQNFVETTCSRIRYLLAKFYLNKYSPGLCGFDCPAEGLL